MMAQRFKRWWSRNVLLALLITLLSTAVAETGYRAGWGDLAENAYSDLWHRLAGVRHVPQHVALVVVDDATLLQYSEDPLVFWTPHIARAAAVLREAGASVVGLDFLFAVSAEGWLRKMNLPESDLSRTWDMPFRNEINTGKLVMVGSRLAGSGPEYDGFLLPHQDYLLAIPDFDFTAGIGLADLAADNDGNVRSFIVAPQLHLAPEMADQPLPRLTLGALLAVRARNLDPQAASWSLGGRTVGRDDAPVRIGYAGPPGTVTRISLSRLLAPDASQDDAVRALKGKVVIIGGEYMGMNDFHATPYSSGLFGNSGSLMTGPEIQANIAETLLAGKSTEAVPDGVRRGYFLLVLGLAVLACRRLTPWHGLLACLFLSLAAAALSFWLFERYWLMPLAHLQLGLAVAYVGVYGTRLTSEERERARITRIFGRYVSDEVVEILLKSKHLPNLGGESLPVTILFSDIRNFTTISEKLAAQEVVEMLNTYFERACAAVLAEGGSIDKFIGDAIMAQFGSPVRHPDHALRAVRAALAMQRAAAEFQVWMAQRFAGRDLPEFRIGVGIHSGEAVIGNIGSSQRLEYTAIGDTVNTASRLEGVTKELGCAIAISQQTLEAAGGKIITGKHQSVKVKGRAQAVEVFEVIEVKEEESHHGDSRKN
jgi:adenylate cyclase